MAAYLPDFVHGHQPVERIAPTRVRVVCTVVSVDNSTVVVTKNRHPVDLFTSDIVVVNTQWSAGCRPAKFVWRHIVYSHVTRIYDAGVKGDSRGPFEADLAV